MAVLAHPDDESLGFGGVLAKYSAEGIATHVVTATRGEAGRYRGVKEGGEHPGRERLGRIREAELRAAAAVLGVRDVVLLGHRDGGVDEEEPRAAARRIAAEVRRLRPHVVVSFGPDGAYGHPDHIGICQFATAALIVAADPAESLRDAAGAEVAPHAVAKLYYRVSDDAQWRAYQEAFKKLTSTVDGVERQVAGWPDWQITTIVDTREYWSVVWRAASCHESQIAGYERLRDLPPEHHEALWGTQQFYRAFSTVNGGRRREDDLFAGLR